MDVAWTVAERAEQARLADFKEKEEKVRSRRELGMEPARASCRAHGKDLDACPLCRDWTEPRPARRRPRRGLAV
jgi:hypothetical protein